MEASSRKPPLFTGKYLFYLIVPLMIEQVLAVTIGFADTIMVARVGESAVSAVALVDSVNILIIQIFAALATGGAVICSQYLGRKDFDSAQTAARQLILITGVARHCFNGSPSAAAPTDFEFSFRSCRRSGNDSG